MLAAAILCLGAGAALAHGETVKTDPKKNAVESQVPGLVSVDLTEAPTEDSLMKVTDGCNRNVASHITIEGKKMIAHLDRAQPGKWKASYQIISAVDGHPTESTWSFTVAGDADCSEDDGDDSESPGETADDEEREAEETEDEAPAPDDDEQATGVSTTSDSDDGGLPLVPIVIGAVALLGLAALVRAKTAT